MRSRPLLRLGLSGLTVLVFMLAVLQPVAVHAAADRETASAGGRVISDFADELDLLGDLWADFPFPAGRSGHVYFRVDTRTSMEGFTSGFGGFARVRDLDYALDLGWRAPWGVGRRLTYSLFAGQTGKQRVDADGQPWIRFVGFGLASRQRSSRVDWNVAAGPVLEEREVEADAALRAHFRWALPGRWGALALKADGLVDGSRWLLDVSGGPEFVLPGSDRRSVAVFLHYQRSRNPLGIGHSALLAGLSYADRPGPGPDRSSLPEIAGDLSAGAGDDGRLAGALRMTFLTPPVTDWKLQVVFDVDANILTARDTGDLFYLYHFGVERDVGGRVAGVYYYHRSNHRLAEPGDLVTSLNVVELGVESKRWSRAGPRSTARGWGRLEGRARIGLLLRSDYGEDRPWHLRGGLRWSLPATVVARLRPFFALEIETGDVERQSFAVGVSPAPDLDVELAHHDDEQYFARDQNVILLSVRYGF